jgi:hypothetical protein
MINRRMSTVLTTSALIKTFRRPSTAGLRWIEARSTTSTTYFMEDRFKAASAGSFVTEVSAAVIATLERLPTIPRTEVFGFNVVNYWWGV